MNDSVTRSFVGLAALLAIWVLVYWLYEPEAPGVTFGERPAGAEASAGEEPVDMPVEAPLEVAAPLAGGEGVAGPVVRAPEYDVYPVREGDTIERIAERVYGDTRFAGVVLRANPLVSPDRLVPGRTELRLPRDPGNVQGLVELPAEEADAGSEAAPVSDEEQPSPAAPDPASELQVEYVISSGDTLSGISKAYYGRASLWRLIYDANRGVIRDPDRLPLGETIRIPPRPLQSE